MEHLAPTIVLLVSAVMVGQFPATVGGTGQPTAPHAAPTAIAQGRDAFKHACASCHGDRGKGDGPAASALKPRPANLTTIAKRKGAFSATDLEATIKGTDPILAHGNRVMPVWGPLFLADANGDEATAELRVANLIAFLESIQARR
jgi:mono/diheme cytochrome c family protein